MKTHRESETFHFPKKEIVTNISTRGKKPPIITSENEILEGKTQGRAQIRDRRRESAYCELGTVRCLPGSRMLRANQLSRVEGEA